MMGWRVTSNDSLSRLANRQPPYLFDLWRRFLPRRLRLRIVRDIVPLARRASNSVTSLFPSFRRATRLTRFCPVGVDAPASQWATAGALTPTAREGHLAELFNEAGLSEIGDTALGVQVRYARFEDWWEPYTLGVGPAGAYVRGLDADARNALKWRCQALLPDAPFTLDAHAWAARGIAQPVGGFERS